MSESPAAFVRAHTRPAPVPLVPELVLCQADEPIGLWELTERDTAVRQPPPFWAFPWAGGQALARHLLDHPALVAGRTVLDLATGSGLVAVAAARAGAAAVTANDIDPLALAAAAVNAAANGVAVDLRPGDLLAGRQPDPGTADVAPVTDVVLAGDVCYSREMTGRVLPFLRRAAARGALVLIGDPGRAYLPNTGLHRVADYRVPVPESLESTTVRETTVWRVEPDG